MEPASFLEAEPSLRFVPCSSSGEFLGAVLVGAKVASTIKNGIISLSSFEGNAGVQLLAFTCEFWKASPWLNFELDLTFSFSLSLS